MKKVFILPDQHYPLHDPKCIRIVEQAIALTRPDAFVNLGDVGEWESVSAWQWKKKKRPPVEMQVESIEYDIRKVNDGLDEMDSFLKKAGCREKYMIEGNHDDWLNAFAVENPAVKDDRGKRYTFKDQCSILDRGYKYFPYGDFLKLGKIHFYHGGHWSTKHHASQHATQLGVNVVYGHTHDMMRFPQTNADSQHAALSMGCVKLIDHKNNPWLRGRKHNWQQGFGLAYIHRSGNFRVEQVTITKGRTFLWGKELVG